ncbi:MAG: hypothetical protein ACI4OA_00325 [Selenomonadaceae bacterium]
MRLSRKGGRKLKKRRENELKNQLGENAADTSRSYRMTRRRHQSYEWSQKPMLVRLAKESSAAATAAVAATIASTPLVSASSSNTMIDVTGAFRTMRNARDHLRTVHAIRHEIEAAKINLEQAKNDLNSAAEGQQSAKADLKDAQSSLRAAETELARVNSALVEAHAEALARAARAEETRAAAEQYAAQLEEQRAATEAAQESMGSYGDAEDDDAPRGRSIDGEIDLTNDAEVSAIASMPLTGDALAARIEAAWRSVDYQQNRIQEVEAIVRGERTAYASDVDTSASDVIAQGGASSDAQSAEMAAAQAKIDEAQAALDELQSTLDAMEAEYDALQDEADEAQSLAEEANDNVADLTNDKAELEADVVTEQGFVSDAEKNKEAADQWLLEAVSNKKTVENDLASVEDAEKHLDDGGFSEETTLEYYNWKGPANGHQLAVNQSFYRGSKNLDVGIDTAYVRSSSGRDHGSVSGMTDTTLAATVKNDHKKYDVHYEFAVNLPTGTETHQNAQLPEGLAHYASFGEGWAFTPGVAVTRHYNEEDSLTGRVSYAWRGGYDYRYSNFETDDDGNRHESISEGDVSPGNQLRSELVWLHAGDRGQAMARLGVTTSASTEQDGQSYKDGNGLEAALYYSHDVTDLDSFQAFARITRDGRTSFSNSAWDSPYNRGVSWHEAGLGWTHDFDREHRRSLHLRASYQRGHGDVYRYTTYGDNAADDYWHEPTRWSFMASYEWRMSERDNLELRVERYYINEHGPNDYRGFGGMLIYTRAL